MNVLSLNWYCCIVWMCWVWIGKHKKKKKNVSVNISNLRAPPIDEGGSDSDVSISDDDDDIYGRDKKWVYKMRQNAPYPKILKDVSPDVDIIYRYFQRL